MSRKVILTGLRANNDLHIGNYFGALLPIIDMAKNRSSDYQINLFVPDLHSFTTPIDHSKLQEQIMNNLRLFVAAGLPLDDDNVHIYRQSFVPAHSELTWILDCFTGFGEMSRMTQFKDKGGEGSSVGLFNYPVLMAADILLYDALYVPVGDDQTQHLEFARDIAQRMNSKFGEDLFVVPLAVKEQHALFAKDQGLRIMDLADPTKKMSKSDDSGKGVIFLGDTPEEASSKIRRATTDSIENIGIDANVQPGIYNLFEILSLVNGEDKESIKQRYSGQTQYGPLKDEVAREVSEFLVKFSNRFAEVNDELIHEKLQKSEAKMNEHAKRTLERVQKAVGLR